LSASNPILELLSSPNHIAVALGIPEKDPFGSLLDCNRVDPKVGPIAVLFHLCSAEFDLELGRRKETDSEKAINPDSFIKQNIEPPSPVWR